jgi:hypothetical protein
MSNSGGKFPLKTDSDDSENFCPITEQESADIVCFCDFISMSYLTLFQSHYFIQAISYIMQGIYRILRWAKKIPRTVGFSIQSAYFKRH